jgi:hypothetical protein
VQVDNIIMIIYWSRKELFDQLCAKIRFRPLASEDDGSENDCGDSVELFVFLESKGQQHK